MKQIVEEWKVIEDLPNHEISNLGQCRYKKYIYLRAKAIFNFSKLNGNTIDSIYYTYMFKDHGKIRSLRVGKLVATYFVPNPNEYKKIIFKDGDPSNHIYTNIEWVPIPFIPKVCKKRMVAKDKQMSNLRKEIDFLLDMEKYIQEDKIAEFVYEKAKPDLKYFIDYKLKRYPEDHRDEFLDYLLEHMIDFMERGNLIYNLSSIIGKHHLRFLSEKNKFKTVQINEEIKYNNGNTDDY